MPVRLSLRPGALCAIVALSLTCAGTSAGQEADRSEQMLIDAEALVVGTEVTTRCALFDSSIAYLTPLEQAGAAQRLGEIAAAAATVIEDMPDRMAEMRARAASMACGSDELVPYMDFSRQIGRDVVDIGLVAWRTIDIERCSYFADDDFMEAVGRARETAQQANIEGAQNRIAYIEEMAAAWVQLFSRNCANLRFNPVETLPGRIALALPTQ